jgi:hypothetical protein
MTGAIGVGSGVAGAALVASLIALGVAFSSSMSARKKIVEQMDDTSGDLEKLGGDIGKLRGEIQDQSAEADRLLARASALDGAGKAAQSSRQKKAAAPAANPRYEEFLGLIHEWSRWSGLRVQGAASVANCKEIEGLVHAKWSTRNDERFAQCANNLVEYLVIATDTKFRQGTPKVVDGGLLRMAELAGCELIAPECGAAWDSQLHDPVDKVARGGSNRAGTIAKVCVRGLRGGSGKITKAKVFLYDD